MTMITKVAKFTWVIIYWRLFANRCNFGETCRISNHENSIQVYTLSTYDDGRNILEMYLGHSLLDIEGSRKEKTITQVGKCGWVIIY